MKQLILGIVTTVGLIGCGGSPPATPIAPSPPPSPGPGPSGPPSTATVVIGSNNTFVPLEVTVAVGGRVVFVNQNSRPFDIMSDPPLTHTDCPAVMEVGFIQPGQTKQTGVLNVARTCGFHDHMNENNPDLRGRIIVQ